MQLGARKLLEDARRAAELIAQLTAGRQFQDDQGDALLCSGVERQFEILGKVLRRLARNDPDIATKIQHQGSSCESWAPASGVSGS